MVISIAVWVPSNDFQESGKEMKKLAEQEKNQDHVDYSIAKIGLYPFTTVF